LSQQISSLIIEARMLNSTFRTKSKSTALARLVLAAEISATTKRCFDDAQQSRWGEDSDKAKAQMLHNWFLPVTE